MATKVASKGRTPAKVETVEDESSETPKRRGRSVSRWLYEAFAEFIEQETGYNADIQSLVHAGVLRNAFRQSEIYANAKLANVGVRSNSKLTDEERAERVAKKEMREAKKAALAAFEEQWAAKRGLVVSSSEPKARTKKSKQNDEDVF